MRYEDFSRLDVNIENADYAISIKASRMEREFDEKSRNHILYSDIEYKTDDFIWSGTLPVVKIPFKDPAVGFLLDGVMFSSVGIYQRAPGVIRSPDTLKNGEMAAKIDIVTARNSTFSISYRKNGVQIEFKRGTSRYLPIGIFLKALSGLPYSVILEKFVYKPQMLLNSFPCEIPSKNVDLAKVATYGIDSNEEPSGEECVSAVYYAITQMDSRKKTTNYSSHWQDDRIKDYLNNLKFKSISNYETNLSLANRAVGEYMDEDLHLPIFNEDGSVGELTIPKGTFISDDVAGELRWHDVSKLRVRSDRSFVLQEENPMLFRAKGYKLARAIPALGLDAGTILDKESLKQINDTDMNILEVFTPTGRKTMYRSGTNVELGDFYTILNCMFTGSFQKVNDSSQYEVGNRIILDYNKQVSQEIEYTYSDIISSITGSSQLQNLLQSLPKLPSVRLAQKLRDIRNKEIAQADITNIMTRAISESRASALLASTPVAMTAVQLGQYARLDSLHAPESDKAGSVQQLTVTSKIDEDSGGILTPYEVVKNGVPTGEIEYITAAKENNKYIAEWCDTLKSPTIKVRFNGDVTTIARERVDYRDSSPYCDMSIARATIPFPEFSQPRRSLMATKMSGQAIPLLYPEAPRVMTGAETEIPCLYYRARDILALCGVAEKSGCLLELINVNWTATMGAYTCIYGDKSFVYAIPYTVTDKKTLYNYDLNYKPDYKYELDDIVFYNHNCDMKQREVWSRMSQGTLPLVKDVNSPAMALGVNLTIAVKTYGANTVEDAIAINKRLYSDDTLTSIQIFSYEYELRPSESFDSYKAVPKLGSFVNSGDSVITVFRSKQAGHVTKHLYAKQAGEVVHSEIDSTGNKATVLVSTFHRVAVGDKMAGRFGDKSVIANLVDEWEMPYDLETGKAVDICYSPLGIPSRMNLGQILEIILGAKMTQQDKVASVSPFYPNIKQEIQNLFKDGDSCMKHLYLPKYGKVTERPVLVGTKYFLKLEQIANLKSSAVGYPRSIDPVFGQPVKSSNHNKGQVISEMEAWALIASGAHKALDFYSTIGSEDETSRKKYFEVLSANKDGHGVAWDESEADSLNHKIDNMGALSTQVVFRMHGLDLEVRENRYFTTPLNMDDIPVEVSPLQLKNHTELTKYNEWSKVKLASPIVNPFWIHSFPLNIILGIKSVKALVAGKHYYNVHNKQTVPGSYLESYELAAYITGMDALVELIKNTTIDEAISRLNNSNGNNDSDTIEVEVVYTEQDEELSSEQAQMQELIGDISNVTTDVAELIKFLVGIKNSGKDLDVLIWHYLPVMPKVFRQTSVTRGVEREHSFQKQIRDICERATSQDIYEALLTFIGIGVSKNDDLISIARYFFGKGAKPGKHGSMRGNILSKRVGFSGRSVIVPANDEKMSPFFIGLPWNTTMIMLSEYLSLRILKREEKIVYKIREELDLTDGEIESLTRTEWITLIESLGEYNSVLLKRYFPNVNKGDLKFIFNTLREEVEDILCGKVRADGAILVDGEYCFPEDLPDDVTIDAAVVCAGRQPTLKKNSYRTYFLKLVEGDCLRLHPLVCGGYNADFDGDTMYYIQLFGDTKNESWKKTSVLQDLISEQDGSYMLALSQDASLGMYCATIFKDNDDTFKGDKGDYYYFDDISHLRTCIEYGRVKYYDAVWYHKGDGEDYISTAGRILVNGVVEGAMTKVPFTDPHGICTAVLGEEAISTFCSMKYDNVWLSTGIKAPGRPGGTECERVLLENYATYGARPSINVAQTLYEIGVVASDLYSVTFSLEDMSTEVDLESYMHKPQKYVAKLNSLYQMGMISSDERKRASVRAWESAKKEAQKAVVNNVSPKSNTYFMMYSGARGKPDQVMQSVGFIGNIAKTSQSDIEYPILRGYGSGLSALDLFQTCYTARIGVASMQSDIKMTGYAKRQSVYMTSSIKIDQESCDIECRTIPVQFSNDTAYVVGPDDKKEPLDALIGKFVDDSTEGFDLLRLHLNKSGYMINHLVLDAIVNSGVKHVTTFDGIYTIEHNISEPWRRLMVEEYYSYALPYTEDGKITEQTMDWVNNIGLQEIIAFSQEEWESGTCFDREAHLPVDYNRTKHSIISNGEQLVEETIYANKVSPESEGYHYYKNLLDDSGKLTLKALRYITDKGLESLILDNLGEVTIKYELSKLFKDLVIGRYTEALPYLNSRSMITEKTLETIEELQLKYIPVYTAVTCLSSGDVCSKCYGKSLTTDEPLKVGTNLGIASSQASCAPLSQATLNVMHAAGRRSAGLALVSGLSYYMKLLQGRLVSQKDTHKLEIPASHSGYIRQNKYDSSHIQIVDESGAVLTQLVLDDAERLYVPDGCYVDKGDIIVSGLADLDRYSGPDIFGATMKTRYMLLREYHRVFQVLNVSPKNQEIMARAQTSNCYLKAPSTLPYTRDTSEEINNPTGAYIFRMSTQSAVVNRFSGIAAFTFENVKLQLASAVLNFEGLRLNSALGNLVTGTGIGSTKAMFIPKCYGETSKSYTKSAIKSAHEKIGSLISGGYGMKVSLTARLEEGMSSSMEEELLAKLLLTDNETVSASLGDYNSDAEYGSDIVEVIDSVTEEVEHVTHSAVVEVIDSVNDETHNERIHGEYKGINKLKLD